MKLWGLAAVLGVTLASSQPPAPSTSTAFAVRNVRVFDGARAFTARTVVVVDGRIVAVGSNGVAVPPGAQHVDGAGRTLLPGLIDTHVHLSPIFPRQALQQSLAFGVTTVIDMWTGPPPRGFAGTPALARLKEIETNDPADLSALQTAGTGATARGGHPTQMDGGWAALVAPSIDAPAQAEAFVTARLLEGSDFIKIVDDDTTYSFGRTLPTLSKDIIQALATAAHAHGRLAVAHIGTERQAIEVIEAGVDTLAHLFYGPSVSTEFVQLAAVRHVFVIPTLATLYATCGNSDGAAILADERTMQNVRPPFRATISLPSGSANPSCVGAKSAVRRLSEAGVLLLAGTDAPGPGTTYGASVHWELEHLVDAGMSPVSALAAATAVAARVFRMADRGRIQAGMRADLLLVDGDPTKDIHATRNIVQVWKKGIAIPHP